MFVTHLLNVCHMCFKPNISKCFDKLVHCTLELYTLYTLLFHEIVHSGILDSHNSNTNYITIHWTYKIFHATTFVSRLTSRPFPILYSHS